MFETLLLIRIVLEFQLAKEAALRGGRRTMEHALLGITEDARDSIQISGGKPSAPGEPPHSRRGRLKAASTIVFAISSMTPEGAVIGFAGAVASKMGTSAGAQEHGGRYKGHDYPARPFMRPAMLRQLNNFAGSFSGSIGA